MIDKKLFYVICLIFSLNANAETLIQKYEKEWLDLSEEQKKIAHKIFNHAKNDNLSWSATAIAWQESQFGRWQININKNNSWDCGIFQNNILSVLNHQDIPHNRYNKKEICTDLIIDFDYAYINFAKEIKFWERVHKGNWDKIWSSYNGGWKGNKYYSKSISSRIFVLKKYMARKEYE